MIIFNIVLYIYISLIQKYQDSTSIYFYRYIYIGHCVIILLRVANGNNKNILYKKEIFMNICQWCKNQLNCKDENCTEFKYWGWWK